MLNDILTVVGVLGILSMLVVAVVKSERFFYVMLIVKPFIDITVNSTIVAGFNALELSAGLIFFMALIKYFALKDKSTLYNHFVIWFFIFLQVLSYLLALNQGEQTMLWGIKFFLKLFDSYFIYFLAATELLNTNKNRIEVYKNIWITTLCMGVITIIIYYTGLSNSDTSKGFVRYNGLYNDPGTPSYLAVVSLLYMLLHSELIGKKKTFLYQTLVYSSWAISLFILYITVTKSALLMFVVFIFLWFGVFKKQFIFILPALVIGAFLSYINISGIETRFETEVTFIESGDTETARSLGTGRVTRWENLLNDFNNKFDLPTQLLGTSKNFTAHNQYLAYLMQVGIFGLGAFLIIIFRFTKRLIEITAKKSNPEIFAALTLLMMYCVYSFTGHPFDYTTLLWYLMILLANINVYENAIRQAKRAILKKKSTLSDKTFNTKQNPSLTI